MVMVMEILMMVMVEDGDKASENEADRGNDSEYGEVGWWSLW